MTSVSITKGLYLECLFFNIEVTEANSIYVCDILLKQLYAEQTNK